MTVQFKNTLFIKWTIAREQARINREAGRPKPWSDNDIINTYRFCNVSREDDAVTRVVKEYVRDPMDQAGASPLELSRAMAVCRFFNLSDVIIELVAHGAITDKKVDLEAVYRICQGRMDAGRGAFNSAYLVGAPPGQLVEPFIYPGKVAYVCSIIHRTNFPLNAKSREEYVKTLRNEVGYKDFMAGQIAADLAYTHVLRDAPDHKTWAPFGPGAVRGMNVALGRPIESRLTEEEYLRVGIAQMEALPETIVLDRRLTLHDVASNVNCETFKMDRILKGGHAGRKLK